MPGPSESKFALFSCPVCGSDLEQIDRALQCPKRHSFDLAKSGYVNLLIARGRPLSEGGDTALQLTHRDAFLAKGHFESIADTIAKSLPIRPGGCAILDAGCGSAHHLRRVAERLAAAGHDPACSGIDISKDAASHAARRNPEMAFAVADIWQKWPVRNACADLVLSIFAPKNFPEAARVLRPDGMLAVAYPGPDHLIELRQAFGLLDQREGKQAEYAAAMEQHLDKPVHRHLRSQVQLDHDDIRNAILMGPNARKTAADSLGPLAARPVTIDIELLIARKPR